MTIIRIGAFCLSALFSGGFNGKRPDFETLASYEEFKNTTGTVKNCPVYAENSGSNTGEPNRN